MQGCIFTVVYYALLTMLSFLKLQLTFEIKISIWFQIYENQKYEEIQAQIPSIQAFKIPQKAHKTRKHSVHNRRLAQATSWHTRNPEQIRQFKLIQFFHQIPTSLVIG